MRDFSWSGRRAAGVFLHISSLPSEYGIGNVGAAADCFFDFLKKSGAQVRYTRDGMTAYEIESQRIFFETAQAMDTP